ANMIPGRTAALFGGQRVMNGVATLIAKARGVEIHPSREAKLASLAQGASIGLYGLAEGIRNPGEEIDNLPFLGPLSEDQRDDLAGCIETVGAIAEIPAHVLGAAATVGYFM